MDDREMQDMLSVMLGEREEAGQGMTDEQFEIFLKLIIKIIEKSQTKEEAISEIEALMEK